MTALRKLLVVDDDPVVGASFKRVLSGKGYIVVSAGNGPDALARLQEEKFDAVFTDLRMPGMDGLQVAERVRAAQPWTPVVIVTGYGSPGNEARARAAGVSDFLRKPLSPDMIEDSAERAVRTVPEGAASRLADTAPAAPAEAAPPPVQEAAPARRGTTLRNMVLFLLGPFIGLAYAVLLPFVGIGMLAYYGWQAIEDRPRVRDAVAAAKVVLKLVAAPFVGLVYVVVVPFAALGVLAWMAGKAAFTRQPQAE